MLILRRLLLLALLLSTAFSTARADEISDMEDEIAGSWLVEVAGESRNRVLKIRALEYVSRGVFRLDADYGWYTGNKEPITANLVYESRQLRLTLTTPARSTVAATLTENGDFSGTFTSANGGKRNVTLTKMPPEDIAGLNSAPEVKQPSADTPISCAAFVGGWTGILTSGGRIWLWVVNVGPNCVAKYSYGSSAAVPTEFKQAEILKGVLTVARPTGTATFAIQGTQLVRRLLRADRRPNDSILMHKVNTSDGSLAKLRASQAADRPVSIAPGPNVPAVCAGFFGKWGGMWPGGENIQQFIYVFGIDTNCYVSYSYASVSAPKNFQRVQIKDGLLSFRCNSRSPTVCKFRRSGDDLSAEAWVGADVRNTTVFRRSKSE